jgi:hypothetical protein
MSFLSVTCTTLFAAVCAFTLVTSAGCGTDAKGVDDCRDIEQARCTAAKSCGIVSDVDKCERFYRDQCLHGLPVSEPGSAKVKACVATIRAAGVCATSGVETTLADCPDVTLDAPGVQTACELVTSPEKATECAFLAPDADAGTAGGGGASSSGGSSGDAGAGAGGT